MKKPTIKQSWEGVKGNKWKAWTVNFDGQDYHHQSKTEAMRQYKAAIKVQKKYPTIEESLEKLSKTRK